MGFKIDVIVWKFRQDLRNVDYALVGFKIDVIVWKCLGIATVLAGYVYNYLRAKKKIRAQIGK